MGLLSDWLRVPVSGCGGLVDYWLLVWLAVTVWFGVRLLWLSKIAGLCGCDVWGLWVVGLGWVGDLLWFISLSFDWFGLLVWVWLNCGFPGVASFVWGWCNIVPSGFGVDY